VARFSCDEFVWEAEGEIAGAEGVGVAGRGGCDFPEDFREWAEVFGFVNGAGALLAAGAVAELGDVFRWGMAAGPGGVALVVGDGFAHAGDGVAVDGGR